MMTRGVLIAIMNKPRLVELINTLIDMNIETIILSKIKKIDAKVLI